MQVNYICMNAIDGRITYLIQIQSMNNNNNKKGT